MDYEGFIFDNIRFIITEGLSITPAAASFTGRTGKIQL
jgi:hypothetical protein